MLILRTDRHKMVWSFHVCSLAAAASGDQ